MYRETGRRFFGGKSFVFTYSLWYDQLPKIYKIEIALLSNHVPLRISHSTNVYDISNLIKMLIEVIQQKKLICYCLLALEGSQGAKTKSLQWFINNNIKK